MPDPHSYFDFLRAKGPVTRLPYRNAVAVTGYDETVQVMLDAEHFSSINAVNGAMKKLPFEPVGDDIEAQLEASRPQIDYADQIATESPRRTASGMRHSRSLVSALFTPSRLKALEERLYGTGGCPDRRIHRRREGQFAQAIRRAIRDPDHQPLARHPGRGPSALPRLHGERHEEVERRPGGAQENPLVLIGKEVYVYVARGG